MESRRLSTPWILQIFPLFNSKLGKILATSLREEKEQERERERERERKREVGEEIFWHSNNTKSRCMK
jgi:hypothetical protein